MTDREKLMIDTYIPHQRDPDLDAMEYYWMDNANRVQKVYIRDIMCSFDEPDTYGCLYSATDKAVRDYNGEYGKIHKSDLYDNKQDCKDRTHSQIDWWESLRNLQEGDNGRLENG